MIELPICVFVELIISGEIVLLSMTSQLLVDNFPCEFPTVYCTGGPGCD